MGARLRTARTNNHNCRLLAGLSPVMNNGTITRFLAELAPGTPALFGRSCLLMASSLATHVSLSSWAPPRMRFLSIVIVVR
jgi:hypothetical protein